MITQKIKILSIPNFCTVLYINSKLVKKGICVEYSAGI